MNAKFEWDESNKHKSLLKHGITNQEAETAFDDPQKIILYDEKHSDMEDHYICIGKSELGNILYTTFTFRNGKIRIISTRQCHFQNPLAKKYSIGVSPDGDPGGGGAVWDIAIVGDTRITFKRE